MAKQKHQERQEHLELDLSDLISEAEKAIDTINEQPTGQDEEFSIEVEVDFSDQDDSSEELDLDAELAALEGMPEERSELAVLKEELKKAKKIIRLQKSKLNEKPSAPTPTVDTAQLDSFRSEIAHLKNRIKEGHRSQLENNKSVEDMKEKLNEEQERSKQLRSSYSNMRKKAEELKSTAAQLQTRLRRVQERRKKDAEDNKNFGCTPAVKAMIPAIENLERALNYPQVDKDSLMKGVRLSLAQLANDLAKIGINRVPTTMGIEFDPSIHEAIQRIPNDSVDEGSVVKEIAAGFTLNGRLIRAAKVAVSITLPQETHQPDSASEDEPASEQPDLVEESALEEIPVVEENDESTIETSSLVEESTIEETSKVAEEKIEALPVSEDQETSNTENPDTDNS